MTREFDEELTKAFGVPTRRVDLFDDGLLWLINRVVFHPRGYALGYAAETGDFVLEGDGSEPWQYAPEVEEGALFEKVHSFLSEHEGER